MTSKKELSRLLQVLELNREVSMPMDVDYYEGLHRRIMTRVAETPMAPAAWKEKTEGLSAWRPWRVWTNKRDI